MILNDMGMNLLVDAPPAINGADTKMCWRNCQTFGVSPENSMTGKRIIKPSIDCSEQPAPVTAGLTNRSCDKSNRKDFLVNNEQIIRRAYELAEKVDVKGWVECFTPDGTFTDMSIGVTYRGPDGPTGLGKTVEVYAKAFPDMHRELYRVFSVGDVVVVELALQGTHKGPLSTPMGILPPTGKRMDAPCCDVFRIVNGKIQSFNCYPSGTVIFAQLGVLSDIEAATAHS
jgi:predicted ester cyclase